LSLTTLSVFATVPPACPILSPRPLSALLVRAPDLALYQPAEAIGDRPLPCVTAHRSALTDCTKLLASQLGTRKAVLIYGYDYPDWPMDPAIEAFQVLASRQVTLTDPLVASFDGLIHPVHRRGRVFGWQVQPHDE
jgi:hypothetical protein